MLFLFLNNINIVFVDYKSIQKSYITTKALLTTQQVEIINRKKFAKVVLDKSVKIFIVYITFFTLKSIHLAYKVQIDSLFFKKVTVLAKY